MAAKKKATTKKAATPRRNTEGIATKVRKIVVAKPDIEFSAVASKIGGKHAEGGHAWNIFNHTRKVMEIVNAK